MKDAVWAEFLLLLVFLCLFFFNFFNPSTTFLTKREPCKIWEYSCPNNAERDANIRLCQETTETGINRNTEFGQKNVHTQI